MNKTFLYAVGALVVGFGLGFLLFHSSVGIKAAVVTPSNALDNQALVNELQLIVNPLVGVEQTTTVAIDFPSTSSSTPIGTTTAPGLPALAGDLVFVSPSTSTVGVVYTASVTTPSPTSATFTVYATVASGSAAIDPAASLFTFTVLPKASFIAPVGL